MFGAHDAPDVTAPELSELVDTEPVETECVPVRDVPVVLALGAEEAASVWWCVVAVDDVLVCCDRVDVDVAGDVVDTAVVVG